MILGMRSPLVSQGASSRSSGRGATTLPCLLGQQTMCIKLVAARGHSGANGNPSFSLCGDRISCGCDHSFGVDSSDTLRLCLGQLPLANARHTLAGCLGCHTMGLGRWALGEWQVLG